MNYTVLVTEKIGGTMETNPSLNNIIAGKGSKYAPQIQKGAKLEPYMIEACRIWYRGNGALGTLVKGSNYTVSEVVREKSATNKNHIIDTIIYNEDTGTVFYALYDETLRQSTAATVGVDAHIPSILFSIIPQFRKDEEFNLLFDELKDWFSADYKEPTDSEKEKLAVLCDNVKCRLDGNVDESIKVKLNIPSKTLAEIKPTQLQGYTPTKVLVGEFIRVTPTEEAKKERAKIDLATWAGKWQDKTITLTPEQEALVPVLEDGIIIPEIADKICKAFIETKHLGSLRCRNILFEGDAGSGKSMMAMIMASGLHKALRIFTGSSGTELADILGQFLPLANEEGITLDELVKAKGLPSINDIAFDWKSAYVRITGSSEIPVGMDENGCIKKYFDKVLSLAAELINGEGGIKYKYIPSPIIEAMRYGDVVELQEIACIQNPSTLVALNSLLEGGSIQLPDGTLVTRHPDTLCVFTTNKNYAGLKPINESVLSRMNLHFVLETPKKVQLKERVKSLTGFNDDTLLDVMVDCLEEIKEYCINEEVTGGTYGSRELVNWVINVMFHIDENPVIAGINTVINKAVPNQEDRDMLVRTVFANKMIFKRDANSYLKANGIA